MEFNFETVRLNRLARRMKKGDKRAAAALYDELAAKVFGFCLNRTGIRHVAEDLTQDIFFKLIGGVDTFDEKKGNFSVWFWRLARNVVIDYYRERKDKLFADVGDEAVAGVASHERADALDEKFELERLTRFVGEFQEDEKNLFELRYVSELSYGEIAEITGKSEGALRVMAVRLKKKIRENFKQ